MKFPPKKISFFFCWAGKLLLLLLTYKHCSTSATPAIIQDQRTQQQQLHQQRFSTPQDLGLVRLDEKAK